VTGGRSPIAALLLLAAACGGVVEESSARDAGHDGGVDAREEPLPPLPGAKVFIALDARGTMPVTVVYTDSPHVYCIAELAAPRPGATANFTIRKLDDGSVYATHAAPLGSTETAIHYELPHVDPLPPGMPPLGTGGECSGYCTRNETGCTVGFEEQQRDMCGAGVTCCFNAFEPSAFAYPEGNFACEVDVGGQEAGVVDFRVAYPPSVGGEVCPRTAIPCCDGGLMGPVYPGAFCEGWVPSGARCMGCTCMGEFWSCP
jgi:hypothetical protein